MCNPAVIWSADSQDSLLTLSIIMVLIIEHIYNPAKTWSADNKDGSPSVIMSLMTEHTSVILL